MCKVMQAPQQFIPTPPKQGPTLVICNNLSPTGQTQQKSYGALPSFLPQPSTTPKGTTGCEVIQAPPQNRGNCAIDARGAPKSAL